MARRKRRRFTPEFKADVVRLCDVKDRSIAQVAKDLDLTETAVREWVHKAKSAEGGSTPSGGGEGGVVGRGAPGAHRTAPSRAAARGGA